jgi:hypothetical protein
MRAASFLGQWTRDHQPVFCMAFLIGCAIGIVADLVLVLALGLTSISEHVWDTTQLHPVIAVGGMLLSLSIAWLVRSDWRLVGFAMLLAGHLFTHS